MSNPYDPTVCYGCDTKPPPPPEGVPIFKWVGILWDEALGRFIQVSVCDDCFNDPAHRRRAVKAHFFPAQDGHHGLSMAGSATLDMRGGKARIGPQRNPVGPVPVVQKPTEEHVPWYRKIFR